MRSERVLLLRLAAALAAALVGASAGASSCTVFDGLTAHLDAGGTGGSAPVPNGLLSFEDAARVCSLVASCPTVGPSFAFSTGIPIVHVKSWPAGAMPEFDVRYSACVDWLASPFSPDHPGRDDIATIAACVSAAQSCDGAASCVPVEVLADADPRCVGFAEGHCTPDRTEAIDCILRISSHCDSPLFTPTSECFTVGLPMPDQRVRCGLGYCGFYQGVTCDDDYATLCTADKIRVGFDCGTIGLGCIEGTSGTVGCVGSDGAQACSTTGEESCGGTARAHLCGLLSVLTEVDCEGAGRTCVEEGATARCVGPVETCSPYDADVDVCTDAAIRLCTNGQKVLFDCADIGLGCVPASPGVSAHCG